MPLARIGLYPLIVASGLVPLPRDSIPLRPLVYASAMLIVHLGVARWRQQRAGAGA